MDIEVEELRDVLFSLSGSKSRPGVLTYSAIVVTSLVVMASNTTLIEVPQGTPPT